MHHVEESKGLELYLEFNKYPRISECITSFDSTDHEKEPNFQSALIILPSPNSKFEGEQQQFIYAYLNQPYPKVDSRRVGWDTIDEGERNFVQPKYNLLHFLAMTALWLGYSISF